MTKQTIQSNRETINKIDAPLGVGLIRVLAFLSKSPGEEFIQATIQKNVGMEAWDCLKEYLFELCDKELVHMENKTDTIGHKVYKITSLGMEAFEKIKDLNRIMGRYDEMNNQSTNGTE